MKTSGKVTGKNTPYLVQDDLRAIFSRNPDNYAKCKNCARVTYFEYGKCVSCNSPLEQDKEIAPGYVLCQSCGARWKTKQSNSCQVCRTKIMQKRARRNGR